MKIFYLNSGYSSVFDSQVLSLLEYYVQRKIGDVILLQGYKNKKEKIILESKISKLQLPVIWFKTFPNYTWFDFLNYYSVSRLLGKNWKERHDSIIHIRGDKFGSIVAKYIIKTESPKHLLVDVRGALIEEYINYYKQKTFLKNNKVKTTVNSYKILSLNNIPITAVSERLRIYLQSKFNFKSENIVVNPNIASLKFQFNADKRLMIRQSLGISENERVAIALTGGGSAWQKDFLVVDRLLELGIKVINLSPKSINREGVINLLVPFSEVPNYLSASDIGIIWRDNNLVNNVASPSKFSEFAVNGLYIIHNGTIDLVTDYIYRNKFGAIVSDIGDITIERFKPIDLQEREKASVCGQNTFGIDFISRQYLESYLKIISK